MSVFKYLKFKLTAAKFMVMAATGMRNGRPKSVLKLAVYGKSVRIESLQMTGSILYLITNSFSIGSLNFSASLTLLSYSISS